MNNLIDLREFVRNNDCKLPNFNDSVVEINNKLKTLNNSLNSQNYCISFSDYKELVNKVKEISKNTDYNNVYHSFSDSNLRYYGINEAEEKLKNSKFDCSVSQFFIELKHY